MAAASEGSRSEHPNTPRIARFDPAGFRWHGVEQREYKFHRGPDAGWGWRDVTRHVLSGRGDGPQAFEVRYFEIGPGGHSTLEKHRHVHAVTVTRGRGRVVLATRVERVAAMDFVYVPPLVPHQFINDGEEPFGFFCVVDRLRDRPQPLSAEELAGLRAHPEAGPVIRL